MCMYIGERPAASVEGYCPVSAWRGRPRAEGPGSVVMGGVYGHRKGKHNDVFCIFVVFFLHVHVACSVFVYVYIFGGKGASVHV